MSRLYPDDVENEVKAEQKRENDRFREMIQDEGQRVKDLLNAHIKTIDLVLTRTGLREHLVRVGEYVLVRSLREIREKLSAELSKREESEGAGAEWMCDSCGKTAAATEGVHSSDLQETFPKGWARCDLVGRGGEKLATLCPLCLDVFRSTYITKPIAKPIG